MEGVGGPCRGAFNPLTAFLLPHKKTLEFILMRRIPSMYVYIPSTNATATVISTVKFHTKLEPLLVAFE